MVSYGMVFRTKVTFEGLAVATVISIPSKLFDVPAVALNNVPTIPEVTQTVNTIGFPLYISDSIRLIGKKGKGKFKFDSPDESKDGSYRKSHLLEPTL